MSLLRGLLSGVEGALFLAWCVAWPALLAWGAARGDLVLSVVSVALLVLTPYVARRAARSDLRLARALHRGCHRDFERVADAASARNAFRLHEGAARELEILADNLREAPSRHLLDPHRLADAVDERVALLRRTAPDPPALDLRELVAHDDDA